MIVITPVTRAATTTTATTITMMVPVDMGITCFLLRIVAPRGRVPGHAGGQRHAFARQERGHQGAEAGGTLMSHRPPLNERSPDRGLDPGPYGCRRYDR